MSERSTSVLFGFAQDVDDEDVKYYHMMDDTVLMVDDRPFLVVDKVCPDKVGVDSSFAVAISVFNAGESSAFEISVEDLAWASGENAGKFKVKGGEDLLSTKIEQLEPKENVTYTIEMKAVSSGSFTVLLQGTRGFR